MKQIVLGTAGHIDHGKTALIKTVTGINTDRLKEEQERGITIELGFASMVLPGGQPIGVVDVPGHEKFVKNMVAGATGIDLVAMVIAADEGVMPQTREHMEICTLLGIKHGLIVLTKIDLVDEEWLELAKEDVENFVRGTFLEGAPIVPVSSITGEGIPEFLDVLGRLSTEIPGRTTAGIFRLPVDRVFTMKGFGTVITGTLVSGSVQVGENIMVYPSLITSKIRGIQVHNRSVTRAEAGMRTAVNFQGLEKTSIQRGEVLSNPGALKPSYMLDVSIRYLKSNKKPIKNRARVRFHTGTSEILGILILLDRDELVPDETAPAQIRLDEPVAVMMGDRFVIRSYSPVRTIGGGQILNPIPQKQKRFHPEIVEGLTGLLDKSADQRIEYHVRGSEFRGVSISDLRLMTNLPEKQLEKLLQELLSRRRILQVDKEERTFIHAESFDRIKQNAVDHLSEYHRVNPLKAGMPKEELKSKFPKYLGAKLFNLILNQLIKEGALVQSEENVRLTGHEVSLGGEQSDLKQKILDTYQESGLEPPYFRDVAKTLKMDPARAKDMIALLINEGKIVKAKADLYFHADAVDSLKRRLIDYLKAKEEIDTPKFKEMTGVSRKYLIPLIEHFDATNVTIRIGDIRKLRRA